MRSSDKTANSFANLLCVVIQSDAKDPYQRRALSGPDGVSTTALSSLRARRLVGKPPKAY